MSGIYILWLRQLKRYLRSSRASSQGAGQGNYIHLAPGVIGMTIPFHRRILGHRTHLGSAVRFLKETLVAPVPRILVMIGRTLGGATVAMIQGLIVVVICLAAGFRVTNFHALPEAILAMALDRS
jgi:ABC-2 type transport system permease protein